MVKFRVEDGFVSLLDEKANFDVRRRLADTDVDHLKDISRRYRDLVARGAADHGEVLALGRELYAWVEGDEAWLTSLRASLLPPFEFEIRGPLQPDAAAWAVLNVPWELLADETDFLSRDALLRFAPLRRLGEPAEPAPLDDYRLGVAFMAASPRGTTELDYEAEENAILTASGRVGMDLRIEDSGNPEKLGQFLNSLDQTPPVLHLSCHGHNAWPSGDGAVPQPVLC
jgi:hypothetical protein